MKSIDIKDINFKTMGAWPNQVKYVAYLFIIFIILLASWFMVVKDKHDELKQLEGEEVNLRTDFEGKQARASNLEPLKQQLAQMEVILVQMLRQLPSKNEMPDLIVDVSQQALASGISNELFQPGAEEPKEFYVEKPISIRMIGNYHQFGEFLSGVATLPRVVIMTMHNISLKPRGLTNEPLEMAGVIRTYRYLDPNEQNSEATTVEEVKQ